MCWCYGMGLGGLCNYGLAVRITPCLIGRWALVGLELDVGIGLIQIYYNTILYVWGGLVVRVTSVSCWLSLFKLYYVCSNFIICALLSLVGVNWWWY